MATGKETEFSTLGHCRVIVEPNGKPQIKTECRELASERQLQSAGEDCLAAIPAETAPQTVTAAPKQRIKQELAQGPLSRQWEAQWPEFLHPSHSPTSGQGSPRLAENRLRDGTENSPPHFEELVATRCWAREENLSRLKPGLSRTAEEAQGFASARDDNEKPREDAPADALSSERQRQRFRQFGYEEAEGPWEAYCQLRKFCHQWLMPENHTKEEILELVILEQFLAILPQEMLSWIRERDSESCFHAVALAEHFLLRQRQVAREDQQQQQQQVPRMVQEDALDYSVEENASLDVSLRLLYKEVKQEEEEDASVMVGDESESENEEMLQEKEDSPVMEETISNLAEPRGPEGQEAEMLKSKSTTSEVEARGETTAQQTMPKGKRPSDRLFHSLNKLQKSQTGEELYECSDCGKAFISRAGFIMHIRIHGREKPYECSDCGKHFRRSSHLNSHSKIHAGVKPFKCTDCGKGFSRSSNLISHQRMHTGEKPYTCSSCSKQFCDKSSLVRHERLHTGDRPYKCTECGKSFSQSHHLITHQRSHTGEKPYKCLLCNKSFCDRSTYIRHQKNHTGEKTFKCMDCGECFSRNKHLVRHRSIHTARELYTCSDCGESFCRRSGLKMHQKIHTGEKPFECPDCGKKFNRSTNLISHQRIHTGERPYGCPECGKRFNRRTHLVSHQKIHGPRKEATEMVGAGEELPSSELKGGYVPPSYIITTIV